ncbi:MAG: leucine-rich repeat domain-containing protein [Spirochaetales bacterium]|nr:leucine-rich repeat domain-containing protein [Spirochaetales bacterium]
MPKRKILRNYRNWVNSCEYFYGAIRHNVLKLQHLTLSGGRLLEIPRLEAPCLRNLDLTDNQLKIIPDIDSLPKLQTLVLDKNLITSIPYYEKLVGIYFGIIENPVTWIAPEYDERSHRSVRNMLNYYNLMLKMERGELKKVYEIKTSRDLDTMIDPGDPRSPALRKITDYIKVIDEIISIGEGPSNWKLLVPEKKTGLVYSDVLMSLGLLKKVDEHKVAEGWSQYEGHQLSDEAMEKRTGTGLKIISLMRAHLTDVQNFALNIYPSLADERFGGLLYFTIGRMPDGNYFGIAPPIPCQPDTPVYGDIVEIREAGTIIPVEELESIIAEFKPGYPFSYDCSDHLTKFVTSLCKSREEALLSLLVKSHMLSISISDEFPYGNIEYHEEEYARIKAFLLEDHPECIIYIHGNSGSFCVFVFCERRDTGFFCLYTDVGWT